MVTISEYLPNVDFASFNVVILVFIVTVVLAIFSGVLIFMMVRFMKFNKRIIILEDVAGSDDLEPVGKDRAMSVKVGTGGLEVLYLKKRKVYRGSYGKRMGKNTYYFAIGSDGYWYNVTLGSLNKGMEKVAIRPTKVNMRYQNESLSEIIEKRYNQEGFWQKYGQVVISVIFIAFITIMSYFLFDAFRDAAGTVERAAQITGQVADKLGEVVGGLDSLKASGGIKPAVSFLRFFNLGGGSVG